MTIQEWGAIGEIIGGVAVVASLVYLAMQIRRSGVRDWLQRSEPDWRPEFAALVEELMRLHDTQEAEQAVKN